MMPPLRRRAIQVNVPEHDEPKGPIWTFPGRGTAKDVQVPYEELSQIRDTMDIKHHQLSEWPATAICGNDILSSVLYSSGIVAVKAGKLAPIPMALVACLLYFFRFIYEEVVTAIPLNGGSYNVLLNTTSKLLQTPRYDVHQQGHPVRAPKRTDGRTEAHAHSY